jgi:hypothetical protein
MKNLIATLSVLFAAASCLDAAPDEPATNAANAAQPLSAPTSTSTDAVCRALMRRERTCSDSFIPALVQARVESDNPAGITTEDRAVGREALVKQAFGEWASDSQDASIDALCEQIAQSISPQNDTELRTSASACLARVECDEFVACAVPLSLVRWKE